MLTTLFSILRNSTKIPPLKSIPKFYPFKNKELKVITIKIKENSNAKNLNFKKSIFKF